MIYQSESAVCGIEPPTGNPNGGTELPVVAPVTPFAIRLIYLAQSWVKTESYGPAS